MDKGDLTAAQRHIDSAIAVRKHAQAKSEGHVLFADKLEDLERRVEKLELLFDALEKRLVTNISER